MSQTPTSTPNIPPCFLGGGSGAIANTADQSPQNLDEIKRLDRAGGHCPQQPAQVVACRAQHRIDRISYRPFQPATTHSVISLQVANYRFDRLSALQPAPLLLSQRFGFTAVDDFNIGVIIDPAVSKIDKHLLGLFARVFQQDRGLFELRRENVPAIGVTRKRPCANYQTTSSSLKNRFSSRPHRESTI